MTAKGAVLSEEEKAKARARASAYYHARKNDPEFMAKRRAGNTWAKENPERVKAWRAANREYLVEYARAYRRTPEGAAKHKARVLAKQQFNRALIDSLKDKPCMDCGVKYPPYVMDFDHRPDEEKTTQLSDMLAGHPEHKIREEAAKCDVVCSNCHRERTQKRLTQSP